MVSYTPEVWSEYFPNRKYAVEVRFPEAVKDKDYTIVNRGFGHEIFIRNLDKVKIGKIISLQQAIRQSDEYNKIIPQSKEELKSFWEAACVKEVWRMIRQEFTNIEKGVVELLPIPPGRRERAVIHPSPKKKGYIQWSLLELNPKTGIWEPGSDIQFPDRQALRRHLEVIHRQEVKQAIDEGKSVPQEVLRDYPHLTKKLTTYIQEHVS